MAVEMQGSAQFVGSLKSSERTVHFAVSVPVLKDVGRPQKRVTRNRNCTVLANRCARPTLAGEAATQPACMPGVIDQTHVRSLLCSN